MAVRIQWRRGEGAQWTTTNPILASGEVGFETDSKKFKVGDGTTRWQDLDYYAIGTITGVIAGDGLTGGGFSGNVTLSLSESAITVNYFSAKGDLLTALGDNDPTLLPVGTTDYEVLQVDSAEPTGLKYGQVQSSAIVDNAITTAKILDTSVTTDKIQDNAITSGKIVTNAITSTKIQANAVTGDKIADGSISESKIVDNAITTAKILDNAVTGAKFADNSITSAKIANNTIVNQDINEFANIGLTKLATGALPTAITVTTGNYINNSVNISKLSNTPGPEGVGVWQSWTPTVSGLTTNQWDLRYAKYMRLNNTCMVHASIRLKNLNQDSGGRVVSFNLPLTPVIASTLSTFDEAVVIGNYLHVNVDGYPNGLVAHAVYKNGQVQSWSSGIGQARSYMGGPTGIGISETGDIISFTAMYEVV